MGTYILQDEVGMGLACMTLSISLRKRRHVGHLQWNPMQKGKMKWANLYGDETLGMGDKIYA